MSDVNLKEFVSGFVLEADEHLHSANRNLVEVSEALKLGRPEPRAIRDLFRSVHTIKGLAAMVGAEPIVDISHEMESILRTADRAGGRISERALDLIMQGTRALEERVLHVSKLGVAEVPAAPTTLIEALGKIQSTAVGPANSVVHEFTLPPEIVRVLSPADREQLIQAEAQGAHAYLVEFQPSPERAERGVNITSVRQRISKVGTLVKVIPKSAPQAPTGIAFSLLVVSSAGTDAVREAAGVDEIHVGIIEITRSEPETSAPEVALDSEPETEWTPTDQASIRVNVSRLDEALERLADLINSRSKLVKAEAELKATGANTRNLRFVIAENSRQLARLRAAITAARMVPLAELLQRLPLVVRGLTKDTDKAVDIDIQAGAAEVDKAVADRIFPAIVHLIRNAVDHAVETRSERRSAGKPESASLVISCDDASGTSLVITVTDDGRGIDREAVARKTGLPPARTNEELLQQITTAGLSTSEKVTRVSGRGMGMDIVRRSVEGLGGSISLSTEQGHGTSFSLVVPVSITIIDVMSFVSGGQVFVAPVSMIDEIMEIREEDLAEAPVVEGAGAKSMLLRRRSEAIPVVSLMELLHPEIEGGRPRNAIVVNQRRGAVAFGIDRILGKQEVVVRPLDDAWVSKAGIAGATDLGDGRPTLVLDLANLGAVVMQNAAFTS